MVENPSAFQWRGYGFDPWSGNKIPHAAGQLSLHITAREAPCCNKASAQPTKNYRKGEIWAWLEVGEEFSQVDTLQERGPGRGQHRSNRPGGTACLMWLNHNHPHTPRPQVRLHVASDVFNLPALQAEFDSLSVWLSPCQSGFGA